MLSAVRICKQLSGQIVLTYRVGVLALEVVHIAAVDHVYCVNEKLGTPHRLQEITRALQLSHEFHKQLRACIGIHGLHETRDRANHAIFGGWNGTIGDDGWVRAVRKLLHA